MRVARVLGAAGVLAALAVVAVYGAQRIPPIDIPWHLATGRLILESGAPPVTNTLSWTYPDHPLSQQYPLYQAGLWWLLQRFGWEALSAANLLLWVWAALAWLRWAGSPRELAEQPLLVLLVCVGIQRHLLVRPEVCTLLGLGVMLVFLDGYRSGSRAALVGVAATQWLMAQTHQLWVLGVAVQGLFVVHLLASRSRWATRLGLSDADRGVPVGPAVAAVAGSVALLAVSPLGIGTFLAPLAPLLTLWTQGAGASGGAQAQELALVWTDPIATLVVICGGVAAIVALARSRGRWSLLDLGVFAMGVVLVLVAIRGIPFFAVAMGGLVARTRTRVGPLVASDAQLQLASAAAAIVLSIAVIVPGLRNEPRYTSTQLGFGRTVGDWGDGLAASLQARRPGRVLNLGWVAGNPLAYGGFPVFVDPRFEAYPKPFLLRAIAAETDGAVLRGLIEEYTPDAVVAELRKPEIIERIGELTTDGWTFLHVDALFVVLARPARAAVPRSNLVDPATATTGTDSSDVSVLRAQEHLRLARLLLQLGQSEAAARHLEAARTRTDDAAVAAELVELEQQPPISPAPSRTPPG
jgi:hypothetical protein